MRLGKIKEIDIRKVWAHEQYDFSKWLAAEENISELGNTLNLSLTDIETEKFVGSYRCDIICKDELTGKSVLIENQLEQTNHDHLGKIITYASGLDASVVVWIVAEARQEHASAIEWLNKHTDDDLAFFLIEVHAYTIGDSELSDAQIKRQEFWTMFNDVIDQRGKPFNKRKATTDHWYEVAVGSSQCHISIDLVNKDHKIRVGLWITDNKDLFDTMKEHRAEIEETAGFPLEWDRLDKKKASVICAVIPGLDFNDQSNYHELMNKAIDMVLAERKAFSPYIK